MANAERTEKATPKRRQEARRRGQVARSQDLSAAIGLLSVLATVSLLGPTLARRLEVVVAQGLALTAHPDAVTGSGVGAIGAWAVRAFAGAVAPIVAVAALAALVVNAAQVGIRPSPQALKPSFSRLNPLAGLKRLVGPTGLVEAAKSTAKVLVVGGLAYLAVRPRLGQLALLTGATPAQTLSAIGHETRSVALRVVPLLILLALADLIWQKRRLERSLRMTKEEVKQESRQTDIAPEVRRAIRRRQFMQARRRMLADVATADVVVVNPTHVAVALRYDVSKPAPEVVAKGADHVAAAIRSAAEEHAVPIVRDAPLARSLYRDVELGAQIPEQFFLAVAEILAFVYRTAARRPALLAAQG